MIKAFLALAGLALIAAPVAAEPQKAKAKPAASAKSRRAKAKAPAFQLPPLSQAAQRVTSWVAQTGDNAGLPYVVIDKPTATILVFDAKGTAVASGPVLLGIALGDDATPGVGNKSLSEIGPAEKTTPAGRYLAKFGRAAGNVKMLWVDYANSVGIHTIPPANKENRTKRMLSPEIEDNRITYGCINVPKAIYNGKITQLFGKKGGYVYILPDTKPLEAAFPPLYARPIS